MTAHTSDLDRYLRILAGATPAGRLIEIRSATAHGGMRRTFTPATRLDLAARRVTTLATSTDVYVGVLLRHRRAGGRHACERSHLTFIEIDRPDALHQLERYRCPPSVVIASGGSPGHAHAYWQLQQPVDLDELEQANRRLARHLGGDLASVDAARILRPPDSVNRKHSPPTPVTLIDLDASRRYELEELTAGLTDPPPLAGRPRRPAAPRAASSTSYCSPSRPPSTSQLSPAASPTAPARSAARFTTTAPPASSSMTTAGTASARVAPGAPSTTSARCSSGSPREAMSSSSSASASPPSCTLPRPRIPSGRRLRLRRPEASQRARSPVSRSTACHPARHRFTTTALSWRRTVWRSSSTAGPPSYSIRRTTTEKLAIR